MVEHATAIFGVSDSKRLGLVKVNFDTINKAKSVKIVHSIDTSESFETEIER